MSAERDGRRVSPVLTEARTVHSRAETALASLRGDSDPARAEVHAALTQVVTLLEPFKRTGRGCSKCGAPGPTHPRVDDGRNGPGYLWPFSCEVAA